MSNEATDPPAGDADSRSYSDPQTTIASVPEARTRSELWRRVEEVFQQAVVLDSTEHRTAWLDEECGSDQRLRREVEALLAADEGASGSLEEALVGGLKLFSADESARGSGDAGRRIGPYRVVRTLGEGGMGKVLLAARADSEFEQLVALKLIRPGMGSDRIVERFRRERQILANLVHPHIARLLDGGTTEDGMPYLVMEHIEGEPIDYYCDSRRLGITERLKLFETVCAAVAYAHRNLVVHRDLKPANILVTPGGTVKLLDFGIAKLLSPEEAELTGSHDLTAFERPLTPGYASPEQVAGSWVSTASDVYSLGVVLYRLLSGRRPYRTGGLPPREAERRVLEDEPMLPSAAVMSPPVELAKPAAETLAKRRGMRPEALVRRLRGDLDNIILAALEKEPTKRYTTIEPFARDLRNHLVGLPVSARQATFAYRAGKALLRHRVGAAVAAGFLVVLIVAGIGLHLQAKAAARERDTAEAVVDFMLGVFETTDPRDTPKQVMTPKDLLDSGVERLGDSLRDELELRAKILDTVGQAYHELGHFEEASQQLEEAVELHRRVGSRRWRLELAKTLTHSADSLRRLGRNEAAEAGYLEASAIFSELPGDHRSDEVGVENGLGLLYRAMGRAAEAEPHLRRALLLHEAAGREDDDEYAAVLANLGLVLIDSGLYPQAEQTLERALEIDRRIFGAWSLPVASDLHHLGRVHFSLGEYGEAEDFYRRALEMRRESLDPEHPELLATMNSLAAILYRLGELEEPESLFRQVLEGRRARLGWRHIDVAFSLNNLAAVLEARGDYGAAEEHFREALDIRLERFDQRHRVVNKTVLNLGEVLLLRGQTVAAQPLLEGAVETVEELLGPGHPELADYYAAMAMLRRDQGRLDQAIVFQQRAVEIRLGGERGASHPDAAVAQAKLAALLLQSGALEQAGELYQRAIGAQRDRLVPHHLDLATTLTGQGEVMALRGRPAAAVTLLEEARTIRLRHLDAGDWRVGETESVLGAALVRRGATAEGLALLEGGLAKVAAGRGGEHPVTVLARERLAAARAAA